MTSSVFKKSKSKFKDAFGKSLSDYYIYGLNYLIAERDDGFFSDAGGVKVYFNEYKDWPPREKKALKYVKGKVLDLGCGAGRHTLYLQKKGFDVLGIDSSPLAIKVCRKRGLKKARVLDIKDLGPETGIFDTILMLCNNFGLFGDEKKAKILLKMFLKITGKDAVIITESYDSDIGFYSEYRKFNKKKGRMPGHLRVRLRYENYATAWFNYLRVSQNEMKIILKGTGWKIKKIIDSKNYSYIAIIEKV